MRLALARPLRAGELTSVWVPDEGHEAMRDLVVAMEVISSADHWARVIGALGHTPRLIPARYVKPYLKREKSGALDVEAIVHAARQPGTRFVAIKSAEQQSITTSTKTRMLFIRQRTAAVNSLRGLLAEFGFVVPARLANVAKLKQILHFDENAYQR